MKKKPKPKRPGGYVFALAVLAALVVGGPREAYAATDPLKVRVGATDFLLPLQKVSGTQLYSFRDKKGYPGLETVVVMRGTGQLTVGAAPVLGTSENVPFVGVQFRLPARFFDLSNNELMFGAWVGRESDQKRATWGIKATIPLW